MYFNEDSYWEAQRAEYDGENLEVVAKCRECDCDLVEGCDCYCIDNEYYCEQCIDYFKVLSLEKA